jgi:hypothetical protein
MGMNSAPSSPAPLENAEVKASQIGYGFISKMTKQWEEQGITGLELTKKKAEFLAESAAVLKNSTDNKVVTADFEDVELTPELKEAMIAWYEGAARNVTDFVVKE